MIERLSPRIQFLLALCLSTAVSLGLFGYVSYRNHEWSYIYLPWNLFLAWIPFMLSICLVRVLRKRRWLTFTPLTLSILWVVFLPNTFYMITDFIHLQEVRPDDIVFDAVMFTSFIYTGVILGFTSLYLVHQEMNRRIGLRTGATFIGLTLLVSSFAIYIGRDLRWNTWDILLSPSGILFDISDRLLNTHAYPEILQTVSIFFALLSSMYFVSWRLTHLIKDEVLTEATRDKRSIRRSHL